MHFGCIRASICLVSNNWQPQLGQVTGRACKGTCGTRRRLLRCHNSNGNALDLGLASVPFSARTLDRPYNAFCPKGQTTSADLERQSLPIPSYLVSWPGSRTKPRTAARQWAAQAEATHEHAQVLLQWSPRRHLCSRYCIQTIEVVRQVAHDALGSVASAASLGAWPRQQLVQC